MSENLKNKNIMAIDYGTKITGLAQITFGRDPFPVPFGRLKYTDDLKLCLDIVKIVEDECIDLVVVGLPLFLDGKETKMSQKVTNFINLLKGKINIPIETQNESLSSFEAQERMKNSAAFNFKIDLKRIDEMAATVILEDFIKCQN
ncbi:MAG: Holliday junction resolvase RuvX [Halobacteriovoraceae bacterium]|nr:Holliday junction resolvase RuvX [Halobacteriovoraceae bacterium]